MFHVLTTVNLLLPTMYATRYGGYMRGSGVTASMCNQESENLSFALTLMSEIYPNEILGLQ